MAKAKKPPSKDQAIEALWYRGVLHWKLDSNQKEMHKMCVENPNKLIVIGSSRQLGKCTVEGTLVSTVNRGVVKIEDLTTNDFVYGYNEDGSISPTKIKKLFNSGMKEVVDLNHRGVTWATSSEDHAWLVTEDMGKTWKEKKVKDFKANTKIRRVFVDMPGGSVHEPHAYVIGAFAGDGCSAKELHSTKNSLTISSEDSQIPNKIQGILNCVVKKPMGKGNRLPNLRFNYYEQWFHDKKAHEKTIDLDIVKTWDRESQLNLLAGLIDTDGRVTRFGNELTVAFYSQSRSLVECVKYLILYHFQYNITVLEDTRDKYINGSLLYLSITNNLINKRIIKTLTPFLVKTEKKWDDSWEDCPAYNQREDYLGFKLENKRYAQCYDISVDNATSLYMLANGLITHNSFFLVCFAIEYCLQNPNCIVKFVAPKIKDIKRIIAPLVRDITADCPKDIKPIYKTQENIWRFVNGGEIQLAGTDSGHAESIRGNKANLCVIDEAGFCDNLDYIVNSILIPTTSMTGGKIIMASTPSKSLDHDFIRFMRQAQLNNAYIKRTIYDNPRLNEEQIKHISDSLGGVTSVDFRREYLVELITSEEDAVIPEFTPTVKLEIVKEFSAPPYYDAYVSMDLGVRDLTVVLFAYYDFKTATVMIADELVMNGKELITDTLAFRIKEIEIKLWSDPRSGEFKPPMLRVSDNNNLMLLNELQIKHDLLFLPARKDGLDASINHTRMIIKQKRLLIHPKCTTLINHLETGIWNRARTSFARSSDKGHFDAIHSLIYLIRHVDFTKNPYPSSYAGNIGNFHIHESKQEPTTTKFESQLKGLIRRRNPFKNR